MFKYFNIFPLLSDFLLKTSLGIVFFNYGWGKFQKLLSGQGEDLIAMVSSIPFFGFFPVLFAWILALSETLILFALIYGYFNFFPISNLITKIAGLFSLIISLVIVYMHICVWGDNVFSHGPFEILNVEDGKKAIFGQVLLIPISFYIIFNNRGNYLFVNENK